MMDEILHPSAVAFDELSKGIIPTQCSPRSDSVYSCFTQQEAEQWVEWRIEKELDAGIWAITIPNHIQVYAHNVKTFEEANRARHCGNLKTAVNHIRSYWENRHLITPTTVLPEGKWEILLPVDVIVHSSNWEMIVENNYWEYSYYEQPVNQ